MQYYNDSDANETQEWRDAFQSVIKNNHKQRAQFLLNVLYEMAMAEGLALNSLHTSYTNSISSDIEPAFLGDQHIESRITQLMRYNILVLLLRSKVNDKKLSDKVDNINCALNLYEIGFSHFFKAENEFFGGDLVHCQSYILPFIYVRCYLEGLFSEVELNHVCRSMNKHDLANDMPNVPSLYQFAIHSMGITPIMSIYNASIQKYLINKGLLKEQNRKVWAFLNAEKVKEPYSLGSMPLAKKESLNNLIWVVDCNARQLNDAVKCNNKLIQELESLFVSAGWRVIKVIWGRAWDALLQQDKTGVLKQRLLETSDAEFELYSNRDSGFIRKQFFAKYKELHEFEQSLSDEQITELFSSHHDPVKIYSAYNQAVKSDEQPVAILVKSLAKSINKNHQSHNFKNSYEYLKNSRDELAIPLTDKQLQSTPFYKSSSQSSQDKYIKAMRQALGGFLTDEDNNLSDYLPDYASKNSENELQVPDIEVFNKILVGSLEREENLTVGFVKILSILLRQHSISNRIVPIVYDETQASGFEGMFRQYGVYSAYQRTYNAHNNKLVDYSKAINSHIMNESMNEAGAMSSWLALATSYINNRLPMIPIFLHCSIFGFQRIADLVMSASNLHAKGFLIGTMVDQESLNHQLFTETKENSQNLFGSIVNCVSYNPCYAYELAVIMQDGLTRMYANDEKIYYYINMPKEKYQQPAIPQNLSRDSLLSGIKKGMYLLEDNQSSLVQLLGSGSTLVEVRKAAVILKEMFDIDANVWSVTSFNELAKDGGHCDEHNRLKPLDEPKTAWVSEQLMSHDGIIVGATGYVRNYAEQIRAWIPEGRVYSTLGQDGFERNDNSEQLNRAFKVDAVHIAVTTLKKLADVGEINILLVMKAINYFNLDNSPENNDIEKLTFKKVDKYISENLISGRFAQFKKT